MSFLRKCQKPLLKRRGAIHFLTKTCLHICGAMSATDPHISKHSYNIIACSHSKVLHETVRFAPVNGLLLSTDGWFSTFRSVWVCVFLSSPRRLWWQPSRPGMHRAFASAGSSLGIVSLLAGAWLKGVGAASPLNLPGKLASEAAICMLETSS